MPEAVQLSSEDRQSIEALVSQFQKDSEAQASLHYENAATSATASIGPEGGGMNGWITYTQSGIKVYFRATKITSYSGLAALAGGQPISGALPVQDLDGKTGTFIVQGSWGGATLQAWVDGKPVFRVPVPLAGAAPFHFELKGEVRFERRS